MKIAHVTLYPPRGEKHISSSGVASYSKNLITHIAEEGDEQVVICNRGSADEAYAENGITVKRAFDRSPAFVLQIHKALREGNPDVVHIQQELALFGNIATAYLLQWLVFAWRKKVVITLHGVVEPTAIDATFVRENNSRLPAWLVRLAFRVIYTPLMKWSHTIIVHEHYFKDIVIKSYGMPAEKIVVVPHGVETFQPVSRASARVALGLHPRAKVILFMGYATGYKGLDLLIEGFALYAQQHKDALLVIGAGKHPKLQNDPVYLKEYHRLQEKAAELIPQKQYQWRGFIGEQDITTFYSASDVSLYPYTTAMSSSGPMSFAIGHEKPFLVSSAFSGVFNNQPELLFERDPQSLADRLDYFFQHQEQYENISHQLKTERTWSHVALRTLQTYRKTSNQKGSYETEESTVTG